MPSRLRGALSVPGTWTSCFIAVRLRTHGLTLCCSEFISLPLLTSRSFQFYES
ncbi:uncharacterized protein M6B38_177615 [Iris pallida]|uniref:Uncharacterized protein n=1 Tax=Iris pallida TaxID=29817 RepID=A0AAX6DU41_IRIPA|nr:Uncharacterized protein M6B38_227705 [Iris pallida]KAJ6805900.1 uncharacterized protein M6B38_177615 [Iris pallida]